jgi:tripartite-type tricarboxylate transporter receptor subunit TctC
VAFSVLPPALGNIRAGSLRAIALTSSKRSSLLPDVPTLDELGLTGFEAVVHFGLLAPAGTSKEIIDRLSFELQKLVESDDVKQRIHAEGGDPLTSTPGEYAVYINKEETKWRGLMRKLNLKLE